MLCSHSPISPRVFQTKSWIVKQLPPAFQCVTAMLSRTLFCGLEYSVYMLKFMFRTEESLSLCHEYSRLLSRALRGIKLYI